MYGAAVDCATWCKRQSTSCEWNSCSDCTQYSRTSRGCLVWGAYCAGDSRAENLEPEDSPPGNEDLYVSADCGQGLDYRDMFVFGSRAIDTF